MGDHELNSVHSWVKKCGEILQINNVTKYTCTGRRVRKALFRWRLVTVSKSSMQVVRFCEDVDVTFYGESRKWKRNPLWVHKEREMKTSFDDWWKSQGCQIIDVQAYIIHIGGNGRERGGGVGMVKIDFRKTSFLRVSPGNLSKVSRLVSKGQKGIV